MKFPDQRFSSVYVIYDADVLADGTGFIERMSPAEHMPAGRSGLRKRVREIVAGRFYQTEGDEEYGYAYLGSESRPPRVRWFPYNAIDADGTGPDDDYEGELGAGQHRKWVGELTRCEWLIFADSYYIDLDGAGYPVWYEETMGSLTEHGHLEAVNVDNREGWDDAYGGETVISSGMYVSFAYPEDPNPAPDAPGLRDVDAGTYDPARFGETGDLDRA